MKYKIVILSMIICIFIQLLSIILITTRRNEPSVAPSQIPQTHAARTNGSRTNPAESAEPDPLALLDAVLSNISAEGAADGWTEEEARDYDDYLKKAEERRRQEEDDERRFAETEYRRQEDEENRIRAEEDAAYWNQVYEEDKQKREEMEEERQKELEWSSGGAF